MRRSALPGVIFDMDGVLVDSADFHFESWRRLAQGRGVSVTREQFASTFGRQNRDIIPTVFGEVADSVMRSLADEKEAIFRALIFKRVPIVVGAVELLRGLRDAGMALAVGSSAPRANIELVLAAMGVRKCISAIVGGEDVTRGKPDPQVFLLACETLHLEPARCVVIEDAPAGISAANAAGARSIAILRHHPRDAFPHADFIVSRLSDLTVEWIVKWTMGQTIVRLE